jgi:hypothetical protein
VCLNVSGIFKEPATRMLDDDFSMHFTRTFVLKAVAKNKGIFQKSTEYKILNDLFFVTNLTFQQQKTAFQNVAPPRESLIPAQEEKGNFVILFQELTTLVHTWAYR